MGGRPAPPRLRHGRRPDPRGQDRGVLGDGSRPAAALLPPVPVLPRDPADPPRRPRKTARTARPPAEVSRLPERLRGSAAVLEDGPQDSPAMQPRNKVAVRIRARMTASGQSTQAYQATLTSVGGSKRGG